MGAKAMTVFDPATLHQLVEDPRGRHFALDLVDVFRRMLRPRVTRLVEELAAGHLDDAMDAVLSLKVSSTMTGAHELAALASSIEACLRCQDLPGAGALARELPMAATRAEEAIARYVVRSLAADPSLTDRAHTVQGTNDSIR